MKHCENCGKLLEGEGFCENCGYKQEPQQEKNNKFCEECGAELENENAFCEECGYNNVDKSALTNEQSVSNDEKHLQGIEPINNVSIEENKSSKKSGKGNIVLLKGILCALVVITLVLLMVFGYFYFSGNNTEDTLVAEKAEVKVEETEEVETEEEEADKEKKEERAEEEPSIEEEENSDEEVIDYTPYRQILQNYSTANEAEYYFSDIDGNGVVEMFVETGSYALDSMVDIYTIINGQAETIGELDQGHSHIEICGNGEVYDFFGHMGDGSLSQIIIRNGKIEIVASECDSSDYDEIEAYLRTKGVIEYKRESIKSEVLLDELMVGTAERTNASERWNVTATVIDESQISSNRKKINVSSVLATSTIVQAHNDNSPEKMLDDDLKSSWQEGVVGSGIGESVEFYLEGDYSIKYIEIYAGNFYNDEFHWGNNRISNMTIEIGAYSWQVYLPDIKEASIIELSQPCISSRVKIQIDGVHKGTTYDDTCIAEVKLYEG